MLELLKDNGEEGFDDISDEVIDLSSIVLHKSKKLELKDSLANE